ncbi:MAG: thiamine diphosphokinase [Chthonomonadaceae bacterium]|nr:thiamine diphosphokinase [Chthonomonadaceae bacterium]
MAQRVLGVLGGLDLSLETLIMWARSADVVYAADSAVDRLLPAGIEPIVVGDLDSCTSDLHGLRVVRDIDPNSTDCDKLLALAAHDGHKSLTLAGLEGDLLDHVLATLSSVVAANLAVRLVLRRSLGILIKGGGRAIEPGLHGKRVSLIPLVPCSGASLTGVLWEFADQPLTVGGFLSVSNEGTGTVVASLRTGAALLIFEKPVDEQAIW